MAKRLELLKEAMPQIARVAILVKPDNPLFKSTLPVLESAANSLKIELQQFDAHSPGEFEIAFSAMARSRIEAIVISGGRSISRQLESDCRSRGETCRFPSQDPASLPKPAL